MSNEDISGVNANGDVELNEETVAEIRESVATVHAPIAIRADAIRVSPDANGVVVLPAEVALGDISVVGTDLVISMPDGSQWVIVDGAIFVPQLVIGDVEVPPANLAALLIGEEPEPAAGNNQSSGGNFILVVPDLGPPHPLGDLLPPTALDYTPPTLEPLGYLLEDEDEDNFPDIGIIPDGPDGPGEPGGPGSGGAESATATVDEAGLPARGSEPAGSNSNANTETTTGVIVYTSADTPNEISINGVVVTSVGQQIPGEYGTLTVTSIADGQIGYSYTIADNTMGDDTQDVFTVVITDGDGDTDSATLTIDIIDDVPVARDDTDAIAAGQYGPETGNVISGSGTTSGNTGRDTQGADGAQVVGVIGVNGSDSDFTGSTVVQGQYGTLTINSDGSYSYIRDAGSPGGVDDVFTYTLEDGDGDTSSATLTISIANADNTITIIPDPDTGVPGATGGTQVFEAGLPPRGGEPAGSGESADGNPNNNSDMSETATGTITWTDGDGVNVVRIEGVVVTGAGQMIPVEGGMLTVVSYDPDANVIEYSYTLADNTSGDDTSISFSVSVTDADGDTATDMITIDIVDDVPTARNDSDTVGAGQYGPETGNVISGAGTDQGLGGAGADTQGADSASVTNISGVGGSAMVGMAGASVDGQYGTLTINADGSYSYVRDAGTPGGVSDVFTYTLTDGDGDSVTATLTLDITDSGVIVGDNALVRVDDDALPGGNPGGVGDDVDGANLTGTLSGAGADQPINFDFSAMGAPAGFTYVESGSDLLIQQNGVTVITVTLDAVTGAYTVTQNAPIDHAPGGNENNVVFDIGYTVSDVDGDSANGTLTINADDDTPTIGRTEASVPVLSVDETDLGIDDTGTSFAGLFTSSYGADGAGSLVYSLTLSSQGVDSGLDTTDGTSIFLYNNGDGTVEGRVGGELGAVAFVVSVNASGEVSLDQQLSLFHPDSPDNYDETIDIDGGAISLTATITDGDGDEASQSVDIGGNLNFDDDGPSVSLTEGFQRPALMVDETNLGIDDDGNAFAGAFSFDAGADGTKSIVYSLTISEGTDSGLVDTATGQSIFLFTDASGNVEGRVGGIAGAVAFEISVDAAGNVSLDQVRALVHPDNPDNYNEPVSPTAGTIQLTATLTDGDDDVDSATIDLSGSISFKDDGPSIGRTEASVPVLSVDETDLGIDDTGTSFAGLFTSSYGADGAGSLVYSLTLSSQGVDSGLDTTDGTSIFLYNNGDGTVEGRVGGELGAVAFVVSVNASGEVSLDQQLSLFHPDSPDNYDETIDIDGGAISLTATITDGDGDEASQSVDIGGNLNFDDDGPSVSLTEGFQRPALMVDETNLGIDDDGNAFAGAFSFDAGADGTKSIVYSLTISEGTDSGLVDTATGQSIFLFTDASGNVEGRVGGIAGAVAFEISVDAAGNVSLDQVRALVHPDNPDNYNEPVSPTAGTIQLTATLTDGDDDVDSATIDLSGSISFKDDGPSVTVSVTNENSGMAITDDDGTPNSDSFELGSIFGYTPDYGADGQGAAASEAFTLSLSIGEGVDSGLRSGGSIVYLYVNDAGTMVTASTSASEGGVNGGNTVFTVDVDGDGTVTLTQYAVLDHALGSDQLTLPTGLIDADYSVTITDGDNDTDMDTQSIDLGGNLKFGDSLPTAVDDANGLNEGDADVMGNVLNNDAQGADDSIHVVSAVKGDGDVVNAPGVPAVFPIVIVGDYGTLSINADGSYTYTLDNGNADVSGLGQGDQLFDEFTYTMSDFDNDSDAAVLTITITGDNDAPTVNAQSGNVSEEDSSFMGIADSNGVSDDTDSDTDSGDFTFGDADGDPLTFAIGIPTGNYYAADGTIVVWEQVDSHTVVGHYGALAGAPVITVTVNDAGHWTVDLDMPMLHSSAPPAEGDGNIEGAFDIVFPVSASDPYVSTPTTLTINVEDDKPVVTAGTPQTPPSLQTDDTTLGTDDANYASSFNISFGGDGPNGPNAASGTSFALSFIAGSTGIFDTATGMEVQLRAGSVAGTVEGYVNDGSDHVVFTLSVTSAGVVTLDQDRAVFHTDSPSNFDEVTSFSDIATASISLTATATDEDGDFASQTIDITDDVSFRDDGPSVTASVTNEAAGMAITSDATLGSDSFELGSIFGYSSDAGNDGQQSLTESFTLSLGIADGGNSGWTSGGAVVYLYINDAGTVVTASTSATEIGISGSNTVFTVSVDGDGTVTLDQDMALDHVGPGNGAQLVLPNGLIFADYDVSITDGDNDVATDSAQIDLGGNLKFNDDTPTVDENGNFNGSLVLDETRPEGSDHDGPNGSTGDMAETTLANAISASFTVDMGNDLPGTVTYALQLTLANGSSEIGSGLFALDTGDKSATDGDGYGQGDEILLVNDGGVIKGVVGGDTANPYFTISINASGDVTFTQLRNIYHSDPTDNDDAESLVTEGGTLNVVATATDEDGDVASDSLDLSNGTFVIEDDGPSYFDPEDAPDIQNDASGGFTGDLDINAMISTYLGTDGGTVRFPSSLHNTDSGMDSGGVNIIWNVSADGQTLTGMAGVNTILTITLDQDASTYTLDMNGSVDAFTDYEFTDANSSFIGGNENWFGIVPTGQNSSPQNDDSSDVLITPPNGSSVNTNSTVGGIGAGQSVEVGEFFQLDFVTDLTGTPASGGAGYNGTVPTHTFDGHYQTNGSTVGFRKGSGDPVEFKITAIDDADGNGNDVRSGGDRTPDDITGVIISYQGVNTYNGTANSLITTNGTYVINGKSYDVTFNMDGTVNVTGVTAPSNQGLEGTQIAVFTDDGYNSLVFQAVDGGSIKFAGFGTQIQSTDPVDFSVPIQIVDGDGDIVFGDDMDFSLVASGGATTMAFEKIALDHSSDFLAANDDFAMLDGDSRTLMMSSAMAIAFSAAQPAKFAWLFGDNPLSADIGGEGAVALHSQSLAPMPLAGNDIAMDSLLGASFKASGGSVQANLVAAREAVDFSLAADAEPATQPNDLPQGETAQPVVAEQIAIDAMDVAMPSVDALAAAAAAANAQSADLAVVAKEAIVDGGDGEGSVDALIDAVVGQGGHDAVATLMVVGHEAVDFGGYTPANTDVMLNDAMLLADHAMTPVVNG